MASRDPSTATEVCRGFRQVAGQRGAGLALVSSVEKEADLGALLHGALMPSTGRESVREMEGRHTLAFRVSEDSGLPRVARGASSRPLAPSP